MNSKQTIGRWGEAYAARRLQEGGFLLVENNARAGRWGEIDLVMIDPTDSTHDTLVFVEVKTRTSGAFGGPLAAITPHKLRTLRRAGQFYKLGNPDTPDGMRIDVVGIVVDAVTEECISFEHFRNVGVKSGMCPLHCRRRHTSSFSFRLMKQGLLDELQRTRSQRTCPASHLCYPDEDTLAVLKR